jgi:hypothetical protein
MLSAHAPLMPTVRVPDRGEGGGSEGAGLGKLPRTLIDNPPCHGDRLGPRPRARGCQARPGGKHPPPATPAARIAGPAPLVVERDPRQTIEGMRAWAGRPEVAWGALRSGACSSLEISRPRPISVIPARDLVPATPRAEPLPCPPPCPPRVGTGFLLAHRKAQNGNRHKAAQEAGRHQSAFNLALHRT